MASAAQPRQDQTDSDNSDQLSDVSDGCDDVDDPTDEMFQSSAQSKLPDGNKSHPSSGTPQELLDISQKQMAEAYRLNNADLCIRETVRILALTRIVHGDEDKLLMAQGHLQLARVYWKLKKFPHQTLQHATSAKQFLISAGAQKSDLAKEDKTTQLDVDMQIHYYMAVANLALKKHPEAEAEVKLAEAVVTSRKSCGPMKNKGYWQAELWAIRAKCHAAQGKHQLAMECREKQLNLLEKQFGPDSVKLIDVYLEMAKTDAEDKELVVEFCQKAYDIAKANFDENNERLADTAKRLATVYDHIGSDEAEIYAETYYNEALSCYEAALGKSHKKTLQTRLALARLLAKDKPQESLAILQANVSLYADTYGESSKELADILQLIATVNLQLGSVTEAAKHLKQTHRIEVKNFGKSHQRTVRTAKALQVLSQSSAAANLGTSELASRPRFKAIHLPPGPPDGYKRVLPDY